MTSKQRAKLRALAGAAETVYQVGKGNISDNLLTGLGEALEARELVKVSVMKGCEYEPEDLLEELAKKLRAEPVAVIGNKLILYRQSRRKDVKHIEL